MAHKLISPTQNSPLNSKMFIQPPSPLPLGFLHASLTWYVWNTNSKFQLHKILLPLSSLIEWLFHPSRCSVKHLKSSLSLPPLHTLHSIIGKAYFFYLQNTSRPQTHLTPFTITIMVHVASSLAWLITISSPWDPCFHSYAHYNLFVLQPERDPLYKFLSALWAKPSNGFISQQWKPHSTVRPVMNLPHQLTSPASFTFKSFHMPASAASHKFPSTPSWRLP